MTILIADAFERSGIEGLASLGCEVIYEPRLEGDALAAALRSSMAQVLVVRSTRVTASMMDAGPLALVVRAGAGVNTIDVEAASRRGIYVSNCPGRNAAAVAELTFALILSLDRRVPANAADLGRGVWNKKEYSRARGLYGRTLGLLGFGAIAQEVARRARGFGMPVVAWSRRLVWDAAARVQAEEEPGVRAAEAPEEVARAADVLSLHLALTRETRGLVDRNLLGMMKPGAILVNTARAELVDQAALAAAIRDRGLRVGLDVYANEPTGGEGRIEDPLLALPNVVGTHHIGASTEQAQDAIAAETVRIVRAFVESGKVPNVVNLAKRSPATDVLVVRHLDRPGVLAHVFERLRDAGLNVQETENIIFDGAYAAVARIHLDGRPPDGALEEIRAHGDVLAVQLVALSTGRERS
jgi:D-3-phosphoglycerate dehydrogenase